MKVSICIPTYNQANYIELAVNSAVQQTFKPFEIIVSDDCSTDNTSVILKKLSAEISILKIIKQKQNIGIAGNVDCCLRHATGDFVVRLDSDDVLLPFYVEKLIKQLQKYPVAGYAHAGVQEVDQFGNFMDKRLLRRRLDYLSAEKALRSAVTGYRVAANIIMFRREALVAVNYLKGLPNFGEDYYLTSAISAKGFGNIYNAEILSYYRVWVDAKRIRQKRKLAEIIGIYRVFNEVLEPAFKNHGWDLRDVAKYRTRFACEHADCLSWDVYSASEKKEIIIELTKLSSDRIVKVYIWMYTNGLGQFLKVFMKSKSISKTVVKNFMNTFRDLNVELAKR